MPKKQISKHSPEKTKDLKSWAHQRDPEMLFAFREMPLPDAFFQKMAREIVQWSYTQKGKIRLNQFLRERFIHRNTWDKWRAKSPDIDWATSWVLRGLGDNREDLLIQGKYPERTFLFIQPNYDKDWLEQHKEYAALKVEQTDTLKGPITINDSAEKVSK